jgi:hypothetical protein
MEHYLAHGVTPSPAMRAGSLRHMAVLEPLKFVALVVCDGTKASKLYKRWIASGKTPEDIVTPAQKESHLAALAVLKRHGDAASYMSRAGQCEAEYFWDIDGHPCKCKVDKMCDDGTMIEYKTTGQLGKFANTSASMHYHLQLGWYAHATKARRVVVIAQETAAPYDVMVLTVRAPLLKMWYNEALLIARRWWDGDRSGAYPDAFAFELPSWADCGGADALEIDDFLDNT